MYSPPPGHGDCLQAELRQLYYFDTALEEDFNGAILTHIVDDTPGETCLLITVAEKCSWFTPLQFSRAKLTWHISAMTGRPSGRDFKNMVCSRSIKNCLLTFEDTTVAKSFFWPGPRLNNSGKNPNHSITGGTRLLRHLRVDQTDSTSHQNSGGHHVREFSHIYVDVVQESQVNNINVPRYLEETPVGIGPDKSNTDLSQVWFCS